MKKIISDVIMVDKITAKHILVKKRTLAETIIEELNNGAKFEELAKKYSTCPSKKRGGNLGEFGRGQMVKEFEVAAFNLQKGQVTQVPVKTKFGFHIIKRVK
ncbi:MAG: peptidylprolyl isomerase [Candidatus Hodarchaeales archaeon]